MTKMLNSRLNERFTRQLGRVLLFAVCCLLMVSASVGDGLRAAQGPSVVIPGDVSRICYYSNFFYNFPNEDFLYYLNDRLLFWEKPDDLIVPNGPRDKLLKVTEWHRLIKRYIHDHTKEKSANISFNLTDPKQFEKASELLLFLGHPIKKNKQGQYYLQEKPLGDKVDYFNFSLIRPEVLEQQMNRSHTFYFHLKESRVPVPWDFDFLRKVTGLKIDETNFFETMLKDEGFSLLLAVLYRLSSHEIDYISGLRTETAPRSAWKQIYRDRKLLMGLFVLSNALRVDGAGELMIPGGRAARDFWARMVEESGENSIDTGSFEFLRRLALKDDGKLNYLYIFSYFLPETKRKLIFSDYDAAGFKTVYRRLPMLKHEHLTGTAFPLLEDWSFFTLMYALRVRDGQFDFPGGLDGWLAAARGDAAGNGGDGDSSDAAARLVSDLLGEDRGNMVERVMGLRKFLAIYTKFSHRPELLAGGGLGEFFRHHDRYGGMSDFIEKIPVKNPATVSALFGWAQRLEDLGGGDRVLITELFQSLLEILSFTARYAPDRYDYDDLLTRLTQLPLSRAALYDALFDFFKNELKVPAKKDPLLDVMLGGVPNRTVKMEGMRYRVGINTAFKKMVRRIVESQGICDFSDLVALQGLLARGLKVKPPNTAVVGEKIEDAVLALPYPGMSKEAPRAIRDRVTPYSDTRLRKLCRQLVEKIHLGEAESKLRDLTLRLKGDYLIYQLRDTLLGLAYAVNAKDHRIRAFMNPNFIRLHDLPGCGGRTYWDTECKPPKKRKQMEDYHMSGGLSRLNLTFADRWQEHLFRGNVLVNPGHVQSVIMNVLDLYPDPSVDRAMVYHGRLVELGLDLLREATESEDSGLRTEVARLLPRITAGYHYRKIMAYITGESNHHNLFFNELKALGALYARETRGRAVAEQHEALRPLLKKLAGGVDGLEEEMHRFGGIYTNTFGNLRPRLLELFPQETGSLFRSGWLSGAMVDEFKVKMAYHLYKKEIPPVLMGQILYMYLGKTGKQFLRQNHFNDYPITYFMFDVFNTAHLKNLIKKLKKEGYLKLQ